MAKALMFQGTGSDVGKTVLVAGLCRALSHRGLVVLPFKPQNMSNNAAVADTGADGLGGEIGRAQWLQALACGVVPSVHMNPVLLKPQSEFGSQVIVHGKVLSTANAREYQKLKPELIDAVMTSFASLASEADIVLVEGAGSPAEINLREGDIANMGFARRACVSVVLAGDIDRGGVIASLAGTHAILPPDDRAMIKGFVINKFRGDISLFEEGLAAITRFTGWRSFGVLPWLDAVRKLPAEDSVALERVTTSGSGSVRIAVPVLPRISNFDDLDPFLAEPDVELVFVKPGERWPGNVDLVILPGSKSTIADIMFMREQGWDAAIRSHAMGGGRIFGICGGYQMLGRRIRDPGGIEGSQTEVDGLGLLNVETVLEGEKIVRNCKPKSIEGNHELTGYEIHLGKTTGADCARPMITIDGRLDGAISPGGTVRGCYLHGLFGADNYRRMVLGQVGASKPGPAYRQEIESALDSLADAIERHFDVDGLLKIATISDV